MYLSLVIEGSAWPIGWKPMVLEEENPPQPNLLFFCSIVLIEEIRHKKRYEFSRKCGLLLNVVFYFYYLMARVGGEPRVWYLL